MLIYEWLKSVKGLKLEIGSIPSSTKVFPFQNLLKSQ